MSMSNDLAKKQVQKLFKMFCLHMKEYKGKEIYPFVWQNCKECILREIPWQLELHSPIFRDLCFAVWHERILDA